MVGKSVVTKLNCFACKFCQLHRKYLSLWKCRTLHGKNTFPFLFEMVVCITKKEKIDYLFKLKDWRSMYVEYAYVCVCVLSVWWWDVGVFTGMVIMNGRWGALLVFSHVPNEHQLTGRLTHGKVWCRGAPRQKESAWQRKKTLSMFSMSCASHYHKAMLMRCCCSTQGWDHMEIKKNNSDDKKKKCNYQGNGKYYDIYIIMTFFVTSSTMLLVILFILKV